MKIYFVFILTMGLMLGLINTIYAYPLTVTVGSDANGCVNFNDCDAGYSPLDIFFKANVYTFKVDSGAYSSYNSPDSVVSEWIPRDWFWSVNIYDYDPATGIGNDNPLGSTTNFDTSSLALSNAKLGGPVVIDLTSGGRWLQFYAKDEEPRDNIGTMTINVTAPVVPEPISSILFLVGGSTLAARRFMRRKKIDRQ